MLVDRAGGLIAAGGFGVLAAVATQLEDAISSTDLVRWLVLAAVGLVWWGSREFYRRVTNTLYHDQVGLVERIRALEHRHELMERQLQHVCPLWGVGPEKANQAVRHLLQMRPIDDTPIDRHRGQRSAGSAS